MWRLRAENLDEKRAACELVKRAFQSLRGRIPGMTHIEVGINQSNVDYACDVVLMSDFESEEALAAYGKHPEHLRVRSELRDIRIARHQVDYVFGDG
jgi:heme-degrading monooxygenase HmoA